MRGIPNEIGDCVNTEKRVYEFLGIRVFRRFVMQFEKLRHRKDKLHNINYHPGNMSMSSIRSFSGYLIYNVSCHVFSLIFVFLYFVITKIVGAKFIIIDILMIVLSVFNCYCIMLQRYTFIKMNAVLQKRENHRDKAILAGIDEYYEKIEKESDNMLKMEYEVVVRLNEAVHKGGCCYISAEDGKQLGFIATRYRGKEKRKKREETDNTSDNDILKSKIYDISFGQIVIGNTEKIAAKLQEFFRIKKEHNVLYDFSVITENDECEEAYRMLFLNESRDEVEYVIDVLYKAYSKRLSSI